VDGYYSGWCFRLPLICPEGGAVAQLGGDERGSAGQSASGWLSCRQQAFVLNARSSARCIGQSASGWLSCRQQAFVLNARSSARCIDRVMRKPAETRGPGLVVLGLLVAGSLFCGCGSGGVRPTPALLPSQIPAAPVSVS
jgi:hypothetical protein